MIIAIDPGNEKSALVRYDPAARLVNQSFYDDNQSVLNWLRGCAATPRLQGLPLAIEMIASYGMPVGKEVFETCVWIGRFIQAWGPPVDLVYRTDVKLHLCGSARANDTNVRQALLDRFGGKTAVGTKRSPGPLYGISGDKWAALAVAVTWSDCHKDAAAVQAVG